VFTDTFGKGTSFCMYNNQFHSTEVNQSDPLPVYQYCTSLQKRSSKKIVYGKQAYFEALFISPTVE